MAEESTATGLSRKTFIGSGVAQTNWDVDMQAGATSNSVRRGRKGSIHEAKLETVDERKPLFLSRPSDLDLQTEEESEEHDDTQNSTAADDMVGTDSAKGTQRKRVMTDEAEVIARSPSFPRISPTQKNVDRAYCDRPGGPDPIRWDSVVEEHHIIDAIKCRDESAVKRWLVEEGTEVNKCIVGRASHGHFFVGDGTALHWAAYYGQLEIAKLLLNNGADPYRKARGGETVLHWACQSKKKNEELVDELLKTDGQCRQPNRLAELPDNKGWTPLHYACYDNNLKLVQQLINAGADPNAKNNINYTPLHLVNEDSDEILNLLDPDHLLPRMNDPVLQKDIIEQIKNGEDKLFQKWLDRKKGDINRYRGGFAIKDGLVLENGTALHWAAYYGQLAIVKALIEEADIRVLNSHKESVLHWACKGEEKNGEMVEFIVKKRVCVNFADVDGYTALHYACWRWNHNIAKQLHDVHADKTAQNLYGETPLGTAFRTDNKELIDLLDKEHLLPRNDDKRLETSIVNAIRDGNETVVEQMTELDVNRRRGGQCNTNDFEVSNGTALHWAAYYGRMEIAKLLIGKRANPKVMDKNGETVLHWACKSKEENEKMVELLLAEIGGDELKCQVDSTNTEGYTALHYACWQGHLKVAKLLKEAKADPRARSIKGYIPLDFAVVDKKWELAWMLDDRHLLPRAGHPRLEKCIIEGGYMRAVQNWLKSQHTNVDHCRDGEEGGTALHWAAYHGQLDIVKLLIENGANPRARAYDNGTVLHWACRSEKGNRKLVRLLLKKQCKLDDRDKYGYTPFHLAALHGCQGVVEELLQWDRLKVVVDYRVIEPKAVFKAKGNEGHTPLVKASLKGHHSVVNLLLKRDAKVEPQDLRAAIEEGNEHVVSDLLQSPQWPTLLRQSWGETTPFRELIKKMPDVAKHVLDCCVVSNPKTRDPKNKGYEVVLDYSFVEDHQNGDARYSGDEDSESNNDKKEETRNTMFDEVKKQKGFITKYGPPFKKSNHPLNIMVQHGRLEMLTHPVISSLLQHKWFHFGLWFYLLNLLIYIIFLVFLTAFALVVLPPQSNTCLRVLSNPEIALCENGMEIRDTAESKVVVNDTTSERNETCSICELSCTSSSFVYTSAAIVILFALVRLVMEVFQFCYDRKGYISDWTNFPEVLLYTLSIIFAFVFWTPCMCPHKWQWQIGVVTVLLVWIYFIRFCAKFPSTGIYIIMFGKIFITFLNVIVLSVLLLTTFAITFHMTFSEEQFQRSPFLSVPNTMLKITSMTAGDFSFDTVFRQSPSGESEEAKEIHFPLISIILWIVFVIVMPILFINLLIGLAVGDTKEIQEKARLTKLALQVDMILTAEHLLHVLHIHKCFSTVPSSVILTPNKMESNKSVMKYVKDIVYYLSGEDNYDAATLQGVLNCYIDSESEDQNEMSYEMEQMAEYMKEHTVDVKQNMEQMAEYVKDYTMEAKQKQKEALKKAEEHMQSMEQMMENQMQNVKQHIESVEQKMEQRMASLEQKVEQRMKSAGQEMEQRIESVGQKMEQRIESVGQKMEQRIESVEQKVEQRMKSVGLKMEQRIESVEQMMNQRMVSLEQKMEEHMQSVRQMMEEHVKSVKQLFGEAIQQRKEEFIDNGQSEMAD